MGYDRKREIIVLSCLCFQRSKSLLCRLADYSGKICTTSLKMCSRVANNIIQYELNNEFCFRAKTVLIRFSRANLSNIDQTLGERAIGGAVRGGFYSQPRMHQNTKESLIAFFTSFHEGKITSFSRIYYFALAAAGVVFYLRDRFFPNLPTPTIFFLWKSLTKSIVHQG